MLCTADYALSLLSHGHNLTVASLTAAKLKPLKFPVPSCTANTFIPMILNDLDLKNAQFYDKKSGTWTILKAKCQWRATCLRLVKLPRVRRTSLFRHCNFKTQASIIMDCIGVFMRLISYAWSHSLTRTSNLIYVLKRLAPIVAIRIVHMVFPSKITSRYFT